MSDHKTNEKGRDQVVTIPVRLDEKTFKRFAIFDAIHVKKQARRPALFACILIIFAMVALLAQKRESGMIAAVLLTVGIGLPLVYFGTFLSQINLQAVRFGLSGAPLTYTVFLSEDGLTVRNERQKEEVLNLSWSDVRHVYRRKGCTYLYVSESRAFLLPDGCADVGADELWSCLVSHVPQ